MTSMAEGKAKKDITDDLLLCNRCGTCRSVCPLLSVEREEWAGARGKVEIAEAFFRGENLDDDEVRKVFDYCLHCMACEESCPSGMRADEIVMAVRAEMARRGKLPRLKRLGLKVLGGADAALFTIDAGRRPRAAKADARNRRQEPALGALSALRVAAREVSAASRAEGVPRLGAGALQGVRYRRRDARRAKAAAAAGKRSTRRRRRAPRSRRRRAPEKPRRGKARVLLRRPRGESFLSRGGARRDAASQYSRRRRHRSEGSGVLRGARLLRGGHRRGAQGRGRGSRALRGAHSTTGSSRRAPRAASC